VQASNVNKHLNPSMSLVGAGAAFSNTVE